MMTQVGSSGGLTSPTRFSADQGLDVPLLPVPSTVLQRKCCNANRVQTVQIGGRTGGVWNCPCYTWRLRWEGQIPPVRPGAIWPRSRDAYLRSVWAPPSPPIWERVKAGPRRCRPTLAKGPQQCDQYSVRSMTVATRQKTNEMRSGVSATRQYSDSHRDPRMFWL